MDKPKVLVVDDEAALRTMLAANLELAGFDVVEAESGERALELAAEVKPAAVLTDIRMPGMSGVELFRRLRAAGLRMPVVLMTAFALEELVQGALEDGAFAVLPKPFAVDHALTTVRRAVRSPVVLVVDDAKNLADVTTLFLRAAGMNARSVTSGPEAIAALKEGSVDLCVVDLVMPGMNGAELAEEIRALDPGVSIIAVSGYDVPDLIRRVAQSGMHTFLRKPFAPRELIRSIGLARGSRVAPRR